VEEQSNNIAPVARELAGSAPQTRRATLTRCARYTGALIATLALSAPAWASHDNGNDKSRV
jgi:hypothetical protein